MISMIDNRLQLDTLELTLDRNHQAMRIRFRHPGRPVITTRLLQDLHQSQELISSLCNQDQNRPKNEQLRYLVMSSGLPDVFCLGGDLELFLKLIRSGDRERLSDYAHTCTDILYRNLSGDPRKLCTISVVAGEALGGGFEAALAAEVIIAEKRARFGFPEIQFGLFPGMGAFSFLARRISPSLAKRMITSGNIYTAEELHELGVVDLLAEDGRGEEMLHHYIKRRQMRDGGYTAMDRIMDQHNPITHKELANIVDLWVDTALRLEEKNLTMMNYLLKAQSKRWGRGEEPAATPATISRMRA
ncbi:MAG TPA: enoyl-CoA hydratase [Chromatiaceae bacterium]|nr:enoyl-CoA hydratase [Chromatiaceae bacterium]